MWNLINSHAEHILKKSTIEQDHIEIGKKAYVHNKTLLGGEIAWVVPFT